jgi:hypothetical protein
MSSLLSIEPILNVPSSDSWRLATNDLFFLAAALLRFALDDRSFV